ncbi:hypothetical protein EG856_01765 [Mycoplasmopsis phocirhinis]|uniref:Extracellular matrix-binding protein ebh GA module domain-containing protein n=1 Tax=Mycoplasmopsis phocirhinis TaxID=142650 RepID=A0A4P6MSI7_9BACT|nr:variable surface lipoprotein [Mycoplasmopsis phocirhinis]QBF34644.1 hypothetical protein EG856_01765 [Mycoplasmopsis phocirhinis]
MKKTFKLTLTLSAIGSLTSIPFIAAACGPKNDVKKPDNMPKTDSQQEINQLNELKTNAKNEINALSDLNQEQKTNFSSQIDSATNQNSINSIKVQAKSLNELNAYKITVNSSIDEFKNLTAEEKTSFRKQVNMGSTKEMIDTQLNEASTKNNSNLATSKTENSTKVDGLIWLTSEQKASAKNDINAQTSINEVKVQFEKANQLNTQQTKIILDLEKLIPTLKFKKVRDRYKPKYVPADQSKANKFTYVQFAIEGYETQQKVSWLLQYIKRYGTDKNLNDLKKVFKNFVNSLYNGNINNPELYFTSHYLLFELKPVSGFTPALRYGDQSKYDNNSFDDLWTPAPVLGGIRKSYATPANSGVNIEPKDLMVREHQIGSEIGLVNSLEFLIKARDWDSIKDSPYGMPPGSPEYQITGLRKNYQTPYGPANPTTSTENTESAQ